jgi:hypothetical protein
LAIAATVRDKVDETSNAIIENFNGHSSAPGCHACTQPLENLDVIVEKLSSKPPLFVLRNFMSRDECQEIMDSALVLEPAQVASSESSGHER